MTFNPTDRLTPLDLKDALWPEAYFPDYQVEMILAATRSVETYVTSANEMGKDFTLGFIFLTHFVWPWVYYPPDYVAEVERMRPVGVEVERWHSRRGVSTSVAEKHLTVLWSEVARWIDTCKQPLRADQGGPLVINNLQLSFKWDLHLPLDLRPSYAIGMVAEKPEKFQGHHARYTLFAGDECSGMDDRVYQRTIPWRKRGFFISNAEQTQNFYKTNFKKGDLQAV